MRFSYSRRQAMFLFACAPALGGAPAAAKTLRGVFPIMSTPFTADKAVDYEDLAREVEFLDACGVHGMVWPQLASEYWLLTREERFRGMEALAKAARGRKPALVLGVQAPTTDEMLEYARHGEKLEPDGMIAIPPKEARTLEDFLNYYRALAKVTKRPIFVQTSGGAKDVEPKVEALVELAREFPHCAYIKEEYPPILERAKQLVAHRPYIKGVFSGAHGKGWTYEMRLGCDGTCPGSSLSDVYVRIWDWYQGGEKEKALDLFAKLMLLVNLDSQIPGTLTYLMKRRGVFKTVVSRQREIKLSKEALDEIEFNFATLKPFLKTHAG
ncbi:MAG: dihydrodipicolinate synthase family protein [Bryobacteraceae bacterium]|nr:dihydrodipicolinate synthase family protein [Bryobacteraceae bacterium]